MSEVRNLEKQLKIAVKTGKYVVGRREVLRSLKGSKILVWSAFSDLPPQILDQSKSLSIPALKFNGNPVQLGRACGIPFRVSVIAVKSPGDADLSVYAASADYSPTGTFHLTPEIRESKPELQVSEKVTVEVLRKEKPEEKIGEEKPVERPIRRSSKKKEKKEDKVKILEETVKLGLEKKKKTSKGIKKSKNDKTEEVSD